MTFLNGVAGNSHSREHALNSARIFSQCKSMKDSPLGDIQKVDVGIALAHFDLTMQEEGFRGRFLEADPGLPLPENVRYVISYEREL